MYPSEREQILSLVEASPGSDVVDAVRTACDNAQREIEAIRTSLCARIEESTVEAAQRLVQARARHPLFRITDPPEALTFEYQGRMFTFADGETEREARAMAETIMLREEIEQLRVLLPDANATAITTQAKAAAEWEGNVDLALSATRDALLESKRLRTSAAQLEARLGSILSTLRANVSGALR